MFEFLLQARRTKDPLNPLDMEMGFNMVSVFVYSELELASNQ